jgi:hypothetical protein
MTDAAGVSDEEVELLDSLRTLRERLRAWNRKHGRPFQGISDGFRTSIRPELMSACQAFADRLGLLAALPKGQVFAEIGNFFGDFSVKIMEINQPLELHTFDWHLNTIKPANREVLDRQGRTFYHDGDPAITLPKVETAAFDIIYLNKSKDYVGVRRELACCLDKLRTDGFLVVNDFTAWDPVQGIPYGVMPGVCQFINEQSLEVIYLGLHPRGFLNVALRRS